MHSANTLLKIIFCVKILAVMIANYNCEVIAKDETVTNAFSSRAPRFLHCEWNSDVKK